MSDAGEEDAPVCPNGLFNFPLGSVQVIDADEEIMELYMTLATITSATEDLGQSTGGLGYLDASQAILKLELELVPPVPPSIDPVSKAKGRSRRATAAVGRHEARTVSVQLQQDLHMLKASKGDTGKPSLCSMDLAERQEAFSGGAGMSHSSSADISLHLSRHILTQYAFPSSFPNPLLDHDTLGSARIIELGSGTGLLGVLLSPLCATYVASDRFENLRLIQRNLDLNGLGVGTGKHWKRESMAGQGRLEVAEVDWMDISAARRSGTMGQEREQQFDLVLAVDCIFNESLVQPLVDTFVRFCLDGGRTMVWVVIELRSPDVLTLFMETWLSDPSGPWTIIRLSEEAMGYWDGGAKGRWVGWVGWR